MADPYPPFTTRPFTRANTIHRNKHSNTRFLGKLLIFTFFLIAIPLFPSQAPDFINQTVLNKFWELLHLMFIGIAVSYGLFGCRNVDSGDLVDSQSYVSGMFHVSSVFEDGFDYSMYYSGHGQGKGGFFGVKNGSFENPYEENVVQSWSSKYFQREPMVVMAQPHGGFENFGELGSFTDYKPLGLPVRRLKTKVRTRGSPDFGNGSSESSASSVNDSSDGSAKNRSLRFGALGSEILEGKFNESDILGSPIPRQSRSGRMIKERAGGSDTRHSHFRPLSVDETQFESLESRSLRSAVSFSSQVTAQSHSPSSLSPSHSNSLESPKSKMSELVEESEILGSPIPWRSRSGRMIKDRDCGGATGPSHFRPLSVDETQFESLESQSLQSAVSFCSQVSLQSHSPNSMSPSHSCSSESPKSKMSELVKESDILGSPIPWRSRSGRMIKERVCGGATGPSHFRPLSVDETQFESLNSQSLQSMVSFSSQVHSQSHSPSSLSPSHSNFTESPKLKMSEQAKERSPRWSLPPTSPSIPKTMSSKASTNASHSRHYSDGSLLGTRGRKCFEDELKEYCDSQKDDSLSSKEWISGSLKFDGKPAAPSKASSRGKSVRTFRSFRASGNNNGAREAGEKLENLTKGKSTMGSDEIEEVYSGESEQKIKGHNNLSVGFNRQNLGVDCYMPKPTSLENQIRERRERSENSAEESGKDPESSDEETMSATFSVAGSDTFEVDRKAGEFIAKFKEQIRHQRTSSIDTTSIDTPRGLNISGNLFS